MSTFTTWRQIHDGDHDLVVQTGSGDPFSGVTQIAQIIQGIEVPDGGDPVLLEHLRMQINHVPWLLVQGNDIDTPGKCL